MIFENSPFAIFHVFELQNGTVLAPKSTPKSLKIDLGSESGNHLLFYSEKVPKMIPWGSLGGPWGVLGSPWGVLGGSQGTSRDPQGHPGDTQGSPKRPLGIPKGTQATPQAAQATPGATPAGENIVTRRCGGDFWAPTSN